MSSPVEEDPYLALGVAKDADISAIRTAHRKLVLKFHPDRIKDVAEQAKGKDLFQKVQQAYELLSDPAKRERYDDKVKLAELRKEAMTREPVRSAAYPMRPAPAPASTSREYHNGAYYEERVPSSSYFDKDRFEEPTSRASSRKYDEYRSTEYRPTSKSGEKDRKTSGNSSKWDKAAGGMSFGAAFAMKKKASEAKERLRERERDSKTKDREAQAAKAKMRDRDIRRERTETQGRKAFVVDDESDSDTATYVSRSTVRPSKPSPRSKMEPEPERRTPERSHSRRDDDDDSYDEDKWERHHASTRAYIAQSRPNIVRSSSDAHQYWEGEDRGGYGRRSGSDSDRRPASSKGRKTNMDPPKNRPTPSMPLHTSSPANLRNIDIEERKPTTHQRSTSSGTVPREREREREHRRDMPSFGRSQTMPNTRSSKKDNAPTKSSNLKHSENQDSGYGSSSPHTPEMGGISPTRESSRPEPSRQSSTRYQIVEPVEDEEFSSSSSRHRTVLIGDEDRHRRVTSPQRDRSDRRERSERSDRPKINTDSRTRSSRTSAQSPAELRPQVSRHESSRYGPSSPRESPPVSRHNSHRKLFAEVSTEEREPSYSRRYPAESVSTSPRIDPENANYGPYHRRRNSQDDRDHDYFPGSKHRQDLRQPTSSRRGSVY